VVVTLGFRFVAARPDIYRGAAEHNRER